MGHSIEKSAKTVELAVKLALQELDVSKEDVEIDILNEGNKGLLGLIGNRDAKIRVTIIETKGEKARNFLFDIFDKMNVEAEINIEEDENSIYLTINGDDIGIVIGRRGETLDALQYLTSLVVNKQEDMYKRVSVDIENYRQKREDTLIKLANRLADKVKRYRKSITLEPMNPYERRIIHSTLQENRSVRTYSHGDEPNRKVVITLK
ncbi:MAG: RNA-binding cell elongation regulator Jag/EloR [Clostridiales bacterium]